MGSILNNQMQGFYVPQDLLQGIGRGGNCTVIGIPKERIRGERRLALTPEAVEQLTGYGFHILLESGAGLGINYSDNHFSEAGAEIVETPAEVYQADLILKILPPLPEEAALMRPKSSLFSFVPFRLLKSDSFHLLANKRITAVAYDYLQDEYLRYQPIMSAMAEVEGYTSISIAADLLSNNHGGKGILLGGVAGVSPTEIVILGAGNAGTNAARAALALGASVKVFDNNIYRLRQIQKDLGQSLFTSNLHPNVLRNVFQRADVVIGALHIDNPERRFIITEELVEDMKKGALIIDLRMNQGGCFETTCCLSVSDPEIFEQHGVLHFCKPFISNYVARTTSMAFSNLLVPILSKLKSFGNTQNLIKIDQGVKKGAYLYCGKPVNDYISGRFNIRSNNIDIYLTAF